MARWQTLLWGVGAVAGAFALLGVTALLSEHGAATPQPTRPESGECLSEAEQMRREHPELLFNHRHESVREGKRDPQRSLQACVDCHAAPDQHSPTGQEGHAGQGELTGQDGQPGAPRELVGQGRGQSQGDESMQFCTTCHDYVGVQNNCFKCHSDTSTANQGGNPHIGDSSRQRDQQERGGRQ